MKRILITIPCYNEELVLEKNTIAIMEYAKVHLADFDWKILVIDNNSGDKTFEIGNRLKASYPDKISVFQEKKAGRGVALRSAWKYFSDFDVYSYMDADLATDIRDFRFIVLKVADGHDLVTGSRYLPESNIKRSFLRETMSRIYNLILKLALNVSFRDAQCGFKAMSTRLVKELFGKTRDNGWFWDTELMILACRQGYKVLEVPVSWRETRDELRRSKVSPFTEAVRQLRNIWKMRKRLSKKHEIRNPKSETNSNDQNSKSKTV